MKTKKEIREQIRQYLEQGRTQVEMAGDLGILEELCGVIDDVKEQE